MEEWRVVQHFPNYSVSNTGLVRSDIEFKNGNSGRILSVCQNQHGVAFVGLMHNGIQYKRSVAHLVAHAYLRQARSLKFNTPINLDGDRTNNHVDNLMWRPRYFAREYFQQFRHGVVRIARPIVEVKTQEVFADSWTAALTFGLLDRDIYEAIDNRTYVWPTYQRFEVL